MCCMGVVSIFFERFEPSAKNSLWLKNAMRSSSTNFDELSIEQCTNVDEIHVKDDENLKEKITCEVLKRTDASMCKQKTHSWKNPRMRIRLMKIAWQGKKEQKKHLNK